MKIMLYNLSTNDHHELYEAIDKLKKVIRISYRADIYIIDSIGDIFRWAALTATDSPFGKRTVMIGTSDITEILSNMLIGENYLFIKIDKPVEVITIETAKFLSCDLIKQKPSMAEQIVLSKKEAEVIYELHAGHKTPTKKDQNIKYRIMKKINAKNFFQLFIWRSLIDILPANLLKIKILIK